MIVNDIHEVLYICKYYMIYPSLGQGVDWLVKHRVTMWRLRQMNSTYV